jgi:hypothetical protein
MKGLTNLFPAAPRRNLSFPAAPQLPVWGNAGLDNRSGHTVKQQLFQYSVYATVTGIRFPVVVETVSSPQH